ncbi:DNA repair protein Rad1p [Trichomonascus vanleenenianus]|uniref:ssDNA endodeoxyribonuclease RAD1 n=1 Tax=Trichomonascus vanleenenianus TaxID=2268995 RepID=UPI003ECA083A
MESDDEDLFVQATDQGQLYDGEKYIEESKAEVEELFEEQPEDIKEEELIPDPAVSESKARVYTSLALNFQQRIVTDMLAENGLLVLARGLGLHPIVANLVRALAQIGAENAPLKKTEFGTVKENSLILIVGAMDDDNERLRETINEIAAITRPKGGTKPLQYDLTVVNEKMLGSKRKLAYSQGGLFSVTPPIMVADMLNEVIDRKRITGIVILNAECVEENSNIAFLLQMYREVNTTGFIKAVSDQPERITRGMSPLQTQLKTLRLRKVWLWPRFHVQVRNSLMKKSDVVEIAIQPTELMGQVDKCLRGILEKLLAELRRRAPGAETESWNIENVSLKNFPAMVRLQLGSSWNSSKTKQAYYDMIDIRKLLQLYTSRDAVTFLQQLTCLHRGARLAVLRGMSSWIDFPEADMLFRFAKERVLGDLDMRRGIPAELRNEIPVEEPPKWDMLARLLQEVTDLKQHSTDPNFLNGPILVMCDGNQEGTLRPLKRFLSRVKYEAKTDSYSAQQYLKNKRTEYLDWESRLRPVKAVFQQGDSMQQMKDKVNEAQAAPSVARNFARAGFNKRRRVRGGGNMATVTVRLPAVKEADRLIAEDEMEQSSADVDTPDTVENNDEDLYTNMFQDTTAMEEDIEILETDTLTGNGIMDPSDVLVVETYADKNNETLLEELEPSVVILYDPNPAFIRRIEVYRSTFPERVIKVYFMYYQESIEEQRYLTAVRREKDAFSKLIREKAAMPILLHDDGGTSGTSAFLRTYTSRIAGGQQLTTIQPRIIVDARELKSSLPFLLFKRQFEVVPVVLRVGDYILTPRICVERKAIGDLISSLNTGRLYKQCLEMFKYYEMPTLLIEFDESKSFGLDSGGTTEAEKMAQEHVQQKLTLLMISFPKLRIIWSSSPHQTAEIFADLKRGSGEPDRDTARNVGTVNDEDTEMMENDEAITMVQNIPGVTYDNVTKIIDTVPNVRTLCMMTEEEIAGIVGKPVAKRIYEFLSHKSLKY